MPTPPGGKPPARQDNPSPDQQGNKGHGDGPDVLRTATLIAGGAIGVILAITLLSAWRDTGAVATAAISAISAIVGALIGVFALEIKRRSRE